MKQVVICYTWIGIKRMANMNKRLHDKLYPLLVARMGENCVICGIDLFILQELGRDPKLCIDHIDNNNSNNALKNLQLLCRGCNTKKNWSRNMPEPNERNAPPELKASIINKKKVKKYVWGRLESENYALKLDDLIDDLTEFIQNSQQANKNYIASMCSKRHGLLTTEDRNGETYLVPKNDAELDHIINGE